MNIRRSHPLLIFKYKIELGSYNNEWYRRHLQGWLSSAGHKVLTNEPEYRKLQEIRKTTIWDYTYPWFQLVVDSSNNTDTQDHTTGHIIEANNNNNRPRRVTRKPNYLQEYV